MPGAKNHLLLISGANNHLFSVPGVKQSLVLEDFVLEAGVVLSHEVLGVKLLAVLLVQLAHLV